MDPTANNNNDSEAPLTPKTLETIRNLNMTTIHPLQDVPLTSHENIPEMQAQQQHEQQHQQQQLQHDEKQNIQSKKNWVKFDDDVNEHGSSQNNHDQADSAARVTSKSPTALLPPPPPSTTTTSRPRTPTEREKSQTQLQREPVITSPLSSSPTPVQRSIVSSTNVATKTVAQDVAPAVLTTESTHVNLNASGSNSSSNHHQLHHHQQQPLQAHHTQLPTMQHHNNSSNNGTTVATIPVTTTTSTSNNAMHHKSHHQQHPPQSQSHPHSHPNQYQQHHHQHENSSATGTTSPVEASTSMTSTAAGPSAMRTIELSTGRIREGFANGDVIVTLLPANTKWPWITPAIFRPELVPEELMAQGLTLTVEEYVQAMETLVNDYRFTVYNICYKRILVCWIFFAFAVLLALLFSGLQGVALFSLGVFWLFLNAAAIFVCMWIKLRLARGLEKCLARVNRQLIKHKILLILDDRGRISCHKVNLCFLYFDSTQCVNFLNEFLEHTEQNGGDEIKAGWESKLDIDLNDIVIQGSTPKRLSRKQERGMQMFLRYSSRWGMEALRGLVDITPLEPGRHCGQFQCPCQYIKQHLQCKPRGYPCSCIALASDPNLQYSY